MDELDMVGRPGLADFARSVPKITPTSPAASTFEMTRCWSSTSPKLCRIARAQLRDAPSVANEWKLTGRVDFEFDVRSRLE
jgi:hypothetical protein